MLKPNTLKETFDRELESLARTRDELRVQLSLAKAEARDDWKVLEDTWSRIQNDIKLVGDHSKEPVKEIGESLRKLLDEVTQGYARIATHLKGAAGGAS